MEAFTSNFPSSWQGMTEDHAAEANAEGAEAPRDVCAGSGGGDKRLAG